MAATELTTTTVADWDAAETYLAEHTSDATYTLTELTAMHDADLHEIRLDPETRTIWWAYDNSALNGEGWTVEQLTPAEAAARMSDQIDLTQDRMDDPEGYTYGGDLNRDQDTLDEYTEILRLAMPADPWQANVNITARRRYFTRQDALWQRARANMVRDLSGHGEHGGKMRAARILEVTDVQIGRIIREDDQRREALAEAVREARSRA